VIADERELGMSAGLAWGPVADATVVYIDKGISPSMKRGIADAEAAERPVEYQVLAVTPGVTPVGHFWARLFA
jgi:hypothetical protein